MATVQLQKALFHLRRLASPSPATDAQLLDAFIERRSEPAFAALLARHGPMVLGVCRRILRNHHDAEDAFQATFLVLARKAACIVPRALLANWLYGVAFRTALKASATLGKRRTRERQVIDMPEPAAQPYLWDHVEPILDQELSHLADKYRSAIVLCDLEGKSRREAARELRIVEGTLSSRLTKARALLAKRLTRRGVLVPTASIAVLFGAASSAVPCSVLSATAKAATVSTAQAALAGMISPQVAALTEGVLKSLLMTKLKVGAVLFAAILGLGLSLQAICLSSGAEAPLTRIHSYESGDTGMGALFSDIPAKDDLWPVAQPEPPKAGEPAAKTELEGNWERILAVKHGEKLEVLKGTEVTIQGDRFELKVGNKRITVGTFKIDPDKAPKEIDVTYSEGPDTGKTIHAIYAIEDGKLQFRGPGKVDDERPTTFVTSPQSLGFFSVYRRAK